MPANIKNNSIVQAAVAISAGGILAYFLIAPVTISSLFPQYAIIKKYFNTQVCTDLPKGAASAVFLPISCVSLNATRTIGCVYDTSKYVAPAKATPDELILCPLFISDNDARRIKNPALAVLPIDENGLRNLITISTLGSLIVIYLAGKSIRYIIRRRHNPIASTPAEGFSQPPRPKA